MDRSTREVLAANLTVLMEKRPGLGTIKAVVKAGGPPNGTLGRIKNGEVGASVDQLDKIAKVFEIEPWMLLVPNFQPSNPPVLLGAGGDVERALWAKIDNLMSEVHELREGGSTRPGTL